MSKQQINKKEYPKRTTERKPTHPGAVLKKTVFPELGKPIAEIAVDLGITRQSLYQLMEEKRALSPEMAIRLGHYLGNGPAIWLRMQSTYDIWKAEQKVDVSGIPTVAA